MTVTIDHARTIPSLIRALQATFDTQPFVQREPVEELLYSMLLWEAPRNKAKAATKRLASAAVDFNELRVMRVEEISDVLGKTYPRTLERADRIKAVLTELYLREHAVSLEACQALSKRDGRRYLETLEGMPGFAASRITLACLGGHAMPVDQRVLNVLIAGGVLDEALDEVKAAGVMERHVQAGEGLMVHTLLQAWVDDGGAMPTQRSARAGRSKEAKRKGQSAGRRSTASKAGRSR